MWLLFLYVLIFYLGVVYILTIFLSLRFMLASKSSYPIDPLLLSLFHKLAFILTPFIFNIINIKPILKKPGLILGVYQIIDQYPNYLL